MLSTKRNLHGMWVCISPVLLELQLPLLERERVTWWRYLNFVHSDFWITQMFLALFSNSFSWLTYSPGIGYQQYWGCWWTSLPVHLKLSFGLLFLLTWVKSNFMKARWYLQLFRFSVSCTKKSGSSERTLCQVEFAKYSICICGSPLKFLLL